MASLAAGARRSLALGLAVGLAAVLAGCPSSSTRVDLDGDVVEDAGFDAGRVGHRDGGFAPDSPFVYDAYIDPGCDGGVVMPPPPPECDPYDPATCPPGAGCYPYAIYPEGSCGDEVYSTYCAPAGPGMQGDHCLTGTDCAGGYHCFVTGEGTQCLLLCDQTRVPPLCPPGRICGGTDLMGYGACY